MGMFIGIGFAINGLSIGGGGDGSGPAPSAPVNVTPPSIDRGDGLVGTVATTTPGTWDNADSVTGQWQSFDSLDWIDFSGETGLTYTLTESGASLPLRYLETATNTHGDSQAPSNETTPAPLASPGNATAPVIAQINSNTAGVTNPGDWSGNPVPGGYTYQWQYLEPGSWNDFNGETSSSINWVGGFGVTELRCVVTAYNYFSGSNYSSSAESNALS